MLEIRLRTENLDTLSDEALVEKYQSGELGKKVLWNEILDRYFNYLRDTFYKKFYWYDDIVEDVFIESLELTYEAEIFRDWHPDGYSVKNLLFINVLKWRRTKTKADKNYKARKDRQDILHDMDIEKVDEMAVRNKLKYKNNELTSYQKERKNWEKEIEEKAFQFLDLALNDSDSVLASKRKKGRKKVLSALKSNYEQDRNKKDKRKAEEVDMTPDSFANRKNRALDDLVEELKKREFSPLIMAHFAPVMHYNPQPIINRIEGLLSKTERSETR